MSVERVPHRWVQGSTGLFGMCILYFKFCEHCGVQVAVSESEYERLPLLASPPANRERRGGGS